MVRGLGDLVRCRATREANAGVHSKQQGPEGSEKREAKATRD
jgi:hypothetical protein